MCILFVVEPTQGSTGIIDDVFTLNKQRKHAIRCSSVVPTQGTTGIIYISFPELNIRKHTIRCSSVEPTQGSTGIIDDIVTLCLYYAL